jgi:hypothetical protein
METKQKDGAEKGTGKKKGKKGKMTQIAPSVQHEYRYRIYR